MLDKSAAPLRERAKTGYSMNHETTTKIESVTDSAEEAARWVKQPRLSRDPRGFIRSEHSSGLDTFAKRLGSAHRCSVATIARCTSRLGNRGGAYNSPALWHRIPQSRSRTGSINLSVSVDYRARGCPQLCGEWRRRRDCEADRRARSVRSGIIGAWVRSTNAGRSGAIGDRSSRLHDREPAQSFGGNHSKATQNLCHADPHGSPYHTAAPCAIDERASGYLACLPKARCRRRGGSAGPTLPSRLATDYWNGLSP